MPRSIFPSMIASTSGSTSASTSWIDFGFDAGPHCLFDCSVTLRSDSSWGTYLGDPAIDPVAGQFGNAQPVCLNASAPPTCPPGAKLYGFPGPSWQTDLSSISGAEWIWGPDSHLTMTSDDAVFYFVKKVLLPGPATGFLRIGCSGRPRLRSTSTDTSSRASGARRTRTGAGRRRRAPQRVRSLVGARRR